LKSNRAIPCRRDTAPHRVAIQKALRRNVPLNSLGKVSDQTKGFYKATHKTKKQKKKSKKNKKKQTARFKTQITANPTITWCNQAELDNQAKIHDGTLLSQLRMPRDTFFVRAQRKSPIGGFMLC